MANLSWLNITPTSGSGNGTIENSASEHTGRVARTGTVTVTGEGVAEPKSYTVTQEPKAEFVSFDNGSEMAASKGGGNVTITGLTNTSKQTFSWVGDVSDVTIPATYQANGVTTSNGSEITGDPGASSQFAYSLTLSLPENTSVEEISRTLKVTSNGGQYAQIVIKQSAGDATLSLSATEITIPQAGTPAVSVTVSSNTSWTVFSGGASSNQYTLSLSASPSNGGTVTGAGTYNSGQQAQIKATPKGDYSFDRWSDGNTQSTRTITITDNLSLTAYFEEDGEVVG